MHPSRRSFLTRISALTSALAIGPRTLRAAQPRAPSRLPRTSDGLPAVPAGDLGPEFWEELRGEFLIPADEAFFNTGTLGSSPRAVLDAVTSHMTHVERDVAHWEYDPEGEHYISGYYDELWLREKIARAIGADADEIALTQNATLGMNFLANGLALEPGEEVVLVDGCHSGGRGGWELKDHRYGAHVKPVKVPVPPDSPEQLLELFERATTPRTRVWAIPHLTSGTAILFPVEEMCRRARERGIFTAIDGAQTFCQLQIDVRAMGCDAFFSSPHKWGLAPKGSGFLYVRRDALKTLWPTLASGNHDNYEDGGMRLMQYGTANMSLLTGFGKAVDFFENLGHDRVEQRVLALAERLRTGLQEIPTVKIFSPLHPQLRSATTVWGLDGVDNADLMDELWNRAKVRVRKMGIGGVRQCCHIYNLEGEVDRTLQVARDLVG